MKSVPPGVPPIPELKQKRTSAETLADQLLEAIQHAVPPDQVWFSPASVLPADETPTLLIEINTEEGSLNLMEDGQGRHWAVYWSADYAQTWLRELMPWNDDIEQLSRELLALVEEQIIGSGWVAQRAATT